MLAETRLLMSFGFANVGTIAGTARELIYNTGSQVMRNLVLEAEQGAQSNSGFSDDLHLALSTDEIVC